MEVVDRNKDGPLPSLSVLSIISVHKRSVPFPPPTASMANRIKVALTITLNYQPTKWSNTIKQFVCNTGRIA